MIYNVIKCLNTSIFKTKEFLKKIEKLFQIASSCSLILVYYVCKVRGTKETSEAEIKRAEGKPHETRKGKEND